MATYIITEQQNQESVRQGETIQAKSLASAKRTASNRQMFIGTVMVIENVYGHLMAVKSEGKWH